MFWGVTPLKSYEEEVKSNVRDGQQVPLPSRVGWARGGEGACSPLLDSRNKEGKRWLPARAVVALH